MRRPALLFLLLALACDQPPGVDQARTWSPQDHDKAEQNGQQVAPRAAPSGGNADEMLVEMTWEENCASCHGRAGHGDGPNGPLVKAPDLTRPDWQAKVTDAEIAQQIKGGKGLMPKFDIPDSTIKGLIARIRASKGH